jgi:RNA polymerase sigma factor (sigma-70 family)
MNEWNVARARPWDQLKGIARQTACLLAARDGDQLAMDALVHDLTPLLWHVARGCGLDAVRAEDVVQTVWLSLLRSLDALRDPRALVGWLVVTTRREAVRALPRGDRTGEIALLDPSWAELSERDRRVWVAFGRLDHRCQGLLRLTALAGRSEYGAVADALAMPVGSIGPARGRCLSQLRKYLESETGELPESLPEQHNALAAKAGEPAEELSPKNQLISKAWRGVRNVLGLAGPQRIPAPGDRDLAGAAMHDVAQAYVDVMRVFEGVQTMRLDAGSSAGGSS